MTYEELVQERVSVRSYDGSPLPAPLRDEIGAILSDLPPCPFGHRPRLALVDDDEAGPRLGTYGFIRGARTFLAGAVAGGPRAMEDFGWALEVAILRLTGLGLGTCWLGGTLTRATFAEALGVVPGEVVPCVTPVGRPAARRSTVEGAVRWFAGSDRRKPWSELFFAGERPLSPEEAGPWAAPLEAVRRAPSASNQQPWRIHLDASRESLELRLRRTPGYRASMPLDLQSVDMGIAMAHLALVARERGLAGAWSPLSGEEGGAERVALWSAA